MIGALAFPASFAAATPQHTGSTHTYLVRYENHWGYTLERERVRLWPQIAVSERQKFDAFFSNENLAKLVSKRIYCVCKIAKAPDGITLRVIKATLYAL
jgi:hypothetical protein